MNPNLFTSLVIGIMAGWASGLIIIFSDNILDKKDKNYPIKLTIISLLAIIILLILVTIIFLNNQ